jgi:hypothetical protein
MLKIYNITSQSIGRYPVFSKLLVQLHLLWQAPTSTSWTWVNLISFQLPSDESSWESRIDFTHACLANSGYIADVNP